jgi:hypothetical protein
MIVGKRFQVSGFRFQLNKVSGVGCQVSVKQGVRCQVSGVRVINLGIANLGI